MHTRAHTALTPLDHAEHTSKEQAGTSRPKERLKLWEPAPLCSCDPSRPPHRLARGLLWASPGSSDGGWPPTRQQRPDGGPPTGQTPRNPISRHQAPLRPGRHHLPPSAISLSALALSLPGPENRPPTARPGNNHPLRKAAQLGARNGRDGGGVGGGGALTPRSEAWRCRPLPQPRFRAQIRAA